MGGICGHIQVGQSAELDGDTAGPRARAASLLERDDVANILRSAAREGCAKEAAR